MSRSTVPSAGRVLTRWFVREIEFRDFEQLNAYKK